jgi:hypothetical protein
MHATRSCALALLPYFDLCRMIVVDPMHNLFLGMFPYNVVLTSNIQTLPLLGLVKTHFYHIWIPQKILRKTKELRAFHGILDKVCLLRLALYHLTYLLSWIFLHISVDYLD